MMRVCTEEQLAFYKSLMDPEVACSHRIDVPGVGKQMYLSTLFQPSGTVCCLVVTHGFSSRHLRYCIEIVPKDLLEVSCSSISKATWNVTKIKRDTQAAWIEGRLAEARVRLDKAVLDSMNAMAMSKPGDRVSLAGIGKDLELIVYGVGSIGTYALVQDPQGADQAVGYKVKTDRKGVHTVEKFSISRSGLEIILAALTV